MPEREGSQQGPGETAKDLEGSARPMEKLKKPTTIKLTILFVLPWIIRESRKIEAQRGQSNAAGRFNTDTVGVCLFQYRLQQYCFITDFSHYKVGSETARKLLR